MPTEIRLTFTERPERVFTRITLTGPDGVLVALDSVAIAGYDAVARIIGRLVAGTYTVAWQTAGDDGHPVRGDYAFMIVRGATGTVAGPANGSETRSRSAPVQALQTEPALVSPLSVVLRWLTLIGVIAAIGAVSFRTSVLGRVERLMDPEIAKHYLPIAARKAALLGIIAVALVSAAALGRLFMQSAAINGTTRMLDGDLIGSMLTKTMWGTAWLIQLGMAVVSVIGFALTQRRRSVGWIVAAGGTLGLAISLALSGHAVVVERLVVVVVLLYVVHIVAVSAWLGTLLTVTLVGLPLAFRLERDDRWAVVAEMVHTFSAAALLFASAAALAGVFIAWAHLPTWNSLWASDYGRILLVKLGFVAATAAVGSYNWRRVRPSLGDRANTQRLRRSATLELAFAAIVVAVTAVLVGTPRPVS